MGVIYNLECWETRKEILQKSVDDQSEEGMLFSNEQSEWVLIFFLIQKQKMYLSCYVIKGAYVKGTAML